MKTLNSRQIELRLKTVPRWSRRARTIRREFRFAGFLASVAFVNRVAKRAEKANHHPDIDIRWNKVKLALTTHSEGGLTAKDFSLARECDRIASRYFRI
jgi:4a-hydroxytetrahydrobiopterin dehydratase